MPIFLGIDPGLATIGFGVVEEKNEQLFWVDAGIFKTKSGLPLSDRLFEIHEDMETLLKEVKPDAVGVEELFFAKNVTNALAVAHARGVILERIAHYKIPLFEFTPLQIKNNICGYGQAEKSQMQEMVRRALNLRSIPRPDDAADALAVAICTSRVYAHGKR